MLIDIRERDLIKLLPDQPTAQLPVADIWIGLSGEAISVGGVVAERKSLADFQASFVDGRYREQRTRLLAYCSEKKAKPLYILEGDLNRVQGRIGKQPLLKLITRLTLRYGISVLQTASLQETADLCKILESQVQEDPNVFQGEIISYTEVVSSSKKVNRSENLGSAMLQQCPGVSAKVADALLDHYKLFSALLKASQEDLANVKVGSTGRRVGPAIAGRLWELFHSL